MLARFPHSEEIEVDGEVFSSREVLDILGEQLTERRRARIDGVIPSRTYTVCSVLDGIYDRGNVSAVMRSAEALGFQMMHIIESQEGFKAANRVTQGADKWLDIKRWDTPQPCVEHLKERGYRICATHLDASRPLAEIDFSQPTAIVFGNERDGVSSEVLEAADERVIIPMLGFAQSFNISVAAAISLYHALRDRQERGAHGDLTPEQQQVLRAHYYIRSVGRSPAILKNARSGDE